MVISVRGVFLFLISIFQNCICTENDISETHRGKGICLTLSELDIYTTILFLVNYFYSW